MSGRYFKLRLALVAVYVAVVGATALWVLRGWPVQADDLLDAEISAVPGALRGRTLILVVNRSDEDWHEVELVLDGQYVHRVETLAARERHSVPIDDFTYIYLVPEDWNRGVWRDVSPARQRLADEPLELTPTSLRIRAREGQFESELPRAAP